MRKAKSPQLYVAAIKTKTSRTMHLTSDGVPQTIKMLCGKKFDQSKIAKPKFRRADGTRIRCYGIEPLDWDDYNAGRICSCCMDTHVARISRYEHNVTYEPNWQDFNTRTTVEVDGVIAFEHNVFTADLSGYYKIIDGLLFSCRASTPGAYPAVRCRNHYNGCCTDCYLFNEHHQYQMFRHQHDEAVSSMVEEQSSFGYMLRKQRPLNAIDKILIHEAIVVGLNGSEDDD